MDFTSILRKFLIWRIKHLNDRNFLLILSGLIGIFAGLAAVILKEVVHGIQHVLLQGSEFADIHILNLFFPLLGIVLTVVVSNYILREKLGHGITDILYSISKKSSMMTRLKMYSRMITSALTVGFGGSVGLEAPIVVTGSAIGSNIGQLMHLDYKKRTLLVGAGAAGAISAIFNSPVAGVIFSVEVILSEVKITALAPLLIASVAGQHMTLLMLGDDVLFSFHLQDPFQAVDVPYFILLGLVCGLVSVYFTRMMFRVEDLIKSVKGNMKRALIGGVLLGVIVLVFPPIYGEGYNTIKLLLSGKDVELLSSSMFFQNMDSIFILLVFVFGILLVKPVASALTIGSGGSGGIFAPSLFLGGVTGFLFSNTFNILIPNQTVSTSNFTLVGMCGVMSGVLHAPLTAIFLIAEITSGYTLFVPLMLVSAIAYSATHYFEKYSLYTKRLVQEGDLITGDKDRQLLSLIDLKKVIERDLLTINENARLGELVNLVKKSRRNIFPVLNDENELKGIITLDDIREIMFDEEARDEIEVNTIMRKPPASVSTKESMASVMGKFERTGAWNLPVIDEGKYLGFISKSRIFNTYRQKLIRQDME